MQIEKEKTSINWDMVKRTVAFVVLVSAALWMIYFVGIRVIDIFFEDAVVISKPDETEGQGEFLADMAKDTPPAIDAAKIAAEVIKQMPLASSPAPKDDKYINAILAKAKTETERANAAERKAAAMGYDLKQITKEALRIQHEVKKLKDQKAKVKVVEKVVTVKGKCETPMSKPVMQSAIKAKGNCPIGFNEEAPGVCYDAANDKLCFLVKSAQVGKNNKGKSLIIEAGKDLCR